MVERDASSHPSSLLGTLGRVAPYGRGRGKETVDDPDLIDQHAAERDARESGDDGERSMKTLKTPGGRDDRSAESE